MKIRLLSAGDSEIWKDFRLKALDQSPEVFGSSYQEEILYSKEDWKDKLKTSDVFARFIENELVAAAGFYSGAMQKTKHKGILFGMYTMPDYRGRNIASELIEAITIHAQTKVNQIHLNCTTQNQAAKNL